MAVVITGFTTATGSGLHDAADAVGPEKPVKSTLQDPPHDHGGDFHTDHPQYESGWNDRHSHAFDAPVPTHDTAGAVSGSCKEHTPHDPIEIVGDSGFATDGSGVVNPDAAGTPEDPFIIEGWCVTSHGSTGQLANGIRLSSTTYHVVVRDNRIASSTGHGDGLRLEHASNVVVHSNDIVGNFDGISLLSAANNSIIANNVTDSLFSKGVMVVSSDANLFEGNIVSGNNRQGMYVDGSGGNIFRNNTVEDNGWSPLDGGLQILSSSGNLVEGNVVRDNMGRGVYLRGATDTKITGNLFEGGNGVSFGARFYTDGHPQTAPELAHFLHDIDETNTVNGKPLVYVRSMDGFTVPQDAGQVIVVDSTDVVLDYLEISDVDVAVSVAFSERVEVRNSTFTDLTGEGVEIFETDESIVMGNTIRNVAYHGILIARSGDSQVERNTITGTLRPGHGAIELSESSGGTVKGNVVADTWSVCIHVRVGSDHVELENNSMMDCGNEGLSIDDSDHSRVVGNHVTITRLSGIVVEHGSEHALVEANAVHRPGSDDIFIWGVRHVLVQGNTVTEARYGVSVCCHATVTDISVLNNTLTGNSEFGVYVSRAQNVVINGNNLRDNLYGGLYATWDDPMMVVPPLDARNNWWGDESGPGLMTFDGMVPVGIPTVDSCRGMPTIGEGNGLLVISKMVCFYPWLTEPNPEAGAG